MSARIQFPSLKETMTYAKSYARTAVQFADFSVQKLKQPKARGQLPSYFNRRADPLMAKRYADMQVALDRARTPEERASGVPVLDLALYERDPVAWSYVFVDSFAKNGFIIFKNHGIPPDKVASACDAVRTLFKQSEDVLKAKYAIDTTQQRGYGAYGQENHRITPGSEERKGDRKAYMMFGPEHLSAEDMARHGIPGNIWPQEPPDFRERLMAVNEGMMRTQETVLTALATGLGLGPSLFFDAARYGDSKWRTNFYPPIKDAPETGGARSGMHGDAGLCTLLLSSNERGLVVMPDIYDESTWLRPATGTDYLIFNGGKILDRMTRGFLPATWHMVEAPDDPNASRVSIPLFIWPAFAERLVEILCPEGSNSRSRRERTEQLIQRYPVGMSIAEFEKDGVSVVRDAIARGDVASRPRPAHR